MRRAFMHAGTAAIVFALAKAHASGVGGYDFTGSSRFGWSIGYILVLQIASYAVGLPDVRARAWTAAAWATTGAAVTVSVLQLALGSQILPRFVVFVSAVALVPRYVLWATIEAGSRGRRADRDRLVAVVSEEEAAYLAEDLVRSTEKPALLAVAMRPDEAATGKTALVDAAVAQRATVLVLDREAQLDDHIVEQAALLHQRGLRIRSLTLFYEEWLGKLPAGELERTSMMFDIGELHRLRYSRLKRILDLTLALPAAFALFLAVPVVFVANLFANRGPLFYRQLRVGKNGVPFNIVKFRTMRPTAHGLVNEWTAEDDPRITPGGRLLRKTHVDELPQVINVLRNEISFVGPRPEQPHYVDELVAKLPFYDLRHLVSPGITGWAQVKYGYAGSESDALEKLQYEFFYLRNQSLGFDVKILLRTLRSVLGAKGR